MPEELQNLIERIQKDGVDKADNEAKTIINDAKKEASEIISKAEAEAKERLETADLDGVAFTERSKTALSQAARDVVLSVTEALNRTLENISSVEVSKAISGKELSDIIGNVITAYCAKEEGAVSIEVLVSEDDQKVIKEHLSKKFADEMKKGLEVKADKGIISGFKVSLVDDNIQHDFTAKAINEALCQLLRPHLAEIVRESLASQ